MRHSESSVFRYYNPKGVKWLTRLKLRLSHFRQHKFKHGFLNWLTPICSCGQDIEMSTHFLLHSCNHSNYKDHWKEHFRQKWFESNRKKSTLWWQLIRQYKQHSYHERHHGICNHYWEIRCASCKGRIWFCVLLIF